MRPDFRVAQPNPSSGSPKRSRGAYLVLPAAAIVMTFALTGCSGTKDEAQVSPVATATSHPSASEAPTAIETPTPTATESTPPVIEYGGPTFTAETKKYEAMSLSEFAQLSDEQQLAWAIDYEGGKGQPLIKQFLASELQIDPTNADYKLPDKISENNSAQEILDIARANLIIFLSTHGDDRTKLAMAGTYQDGYIAYQDMIDQAPIDMLGAAVAIDELFLPDQAISMGPAKKSPDGYPFRTIKLNTMGKNGSEVAEADYYFVNGTWIVGDTSISQ